MSRDTETKITFQLKALLNVPALDELDLITSPNSLNENTSLFDAAATQEGLSDVINTLKYTNQRPSVEHVGVLRNAQRSRQDDIAGIDHGIRFLQIKMNQHLLQLKSLASTKLKKQAESELYTALVSPIRLLPSEVLVRVFVYCLPECPSPNTTEAPLLLCRVCSLWRGVAFGASQLWDMLYINDGWGTPSAINLLSYWFNSAGNRPLVFHYYKPSDGPFLHPKLDNLIPYSNQIQRLSYDGPTLAQLTTLLALPSDRVGLLETLHLKGDLHEGGYTGVMVTAFGSAPRLREVFLEVDPRFFHSPSSFALPWALLTDLIITNTLRWRDWRRIFLACKSLKAGKFCIDFNTGEVNLPVIPQDVIHHDLAQLKISFKGEADGSFLDTFQFPALNGFSLSGPDGESLFLLTEGSLLSSQITGGSLSRLYLGSLFVGTDDLLRILRHLPALERLAVDLVVDHCQLCQFLTINNDQEITAPVHLLHLTHLALCIRLQVSGLDRMFAARDFSEMVLSRRRHSHHIARLTTVILHICTEDAVIFTVQLLNNIESLLSEECVSEDFSPPDTLLLDTRWVADFLSYFMLQEAYGFR